jgi:hypothetical protein
MDEASLISAELFDALEELARRLRRNDTFFLWHPFGPGF